MKSNDFERDVPTVLIVEDDEGVATVFERWLESEFDVLVATSGTEALSTIERESIAIVLLDRVMPGLSGEAVLEAIRDRGYETQVAVVSAVEPDFDIISMGFDHYVTKPSSRSELRETVYTMLDRCRHSAARREYYAQLSKKAVLEEQKRPAELRNDDGYNELLSRLDTLEEELDDADSALLDDVEFVSRIQSIESKWSADADEEAG